MTATAITAKNFSRVLASWTKSASSARDKAQDIIVFGLVQYSEHGDTGYLTRMVAAATEIRGMNAKRMTDYITGAANVTWSKDAGAFKKAKKGASPEVQIPAHQWWEDPAGDDNGGAKTLKLASRITSLVTQLESALKPDSDKARPVDLEGAGEALEILRKALDKAQRDSAEAEEPDI